LGTFGPKKVLGLQDNKPVNFMYINSLPWDQQASEEFLGPKVPNL